MMTFLLLDCSEVPCFSYGISYFYAKEKIKVTDKVLSHLNSEKGSTPRNRCINKSKFVPSGRLTGSIPINLENIIDLWYFLYEPFCSSVIVITTHCHKMVSTYFGRQR